MPCDEVYLRRFGSPALAVREMFGGMPRRAHLPSKSGLLLAVERLGVA
jgi:hypothetical protein